MTKGIAMTIQIDDRVHDHEYDYEHGLDHNENLIKCSYTVIYL